MPFSRRDQKSIASAIECANNTAGGHAAPNARLLTVEQQERHARLKAMNGNYADAHRRDTSHRDAKAKTLPVIVNANENKRRNEEFMRELTFNPSAATRGGIALSYEDMVEEWKPGMEIVEDKKKETKEQKKRHHLGG